MIVRKRGLFILSFVLLFYINVKCQDTDTSHFNFFGSWKVIRHQSCLHVNIEDRYLLKEYKNREKDCLDAILTIDTNKIFIRPVEACDFVNCNFFNYDLTKKILTEKDSSFFWPYNRCAGVVKDTIIMNFIRKLTTKEFGIKYFITNCKCEMGDDTYKMIIIGDNRIALFTGFDIIILERI